MKIKKLKLIKQITYIVLIVMICNFIMPNYIYASDDNDIDLLEPISQLLCWLPDIVIEFLQNMFVSNKGIKNSVTNYKILYGPATIFSGEIPAFDINFIKPMEGKKKDTKYTKSANIEDITEGKIGEAFDRLRWSPKQEARYTDFGLGKSAIEDKYDEQAEIAAFDGGCEYFLNISEDELKTWYHPPDAQISAAIMDAIFSNLEIKYHCCSYDGYLYMLIIYEIDCVVFSEMSYVLYKTKLTDEEIEAFNKLGQDDFYANTYYESSAKILQNSVATWYKALRRIALVGLLSVLIYIGIRILLTSTSANDKAKYKKMLKDWLIALCILFTMHYIMSITIVVVDNINEIVKASAIGEDGEDVLVTTIRNEIADGDDWGEVLVHIVLYYVIGIYTIIFSIQYIRRTIYLAFLTMISPLITLTYPLDKIKDSKSQAFDMWIKDYMFFTLLQVIHLLIYYILVGMSIDLVEEGNWVYSIIAIGFLIPAEKIVKRMFGFEKSKSMGALAAGATGALVTDVINKIKVGNATKGKSKDNSEKTATGNTKNNIRTALNNPISGMQGGGGFASVPESSGTTGTNTVVPGAKPSIQPIKGVTSLVGRYHRNIGGAVLGSMLGASGAMIGFASGVAQGDLGKAFKGAAAGGTAGYGLGKAGYNFASNTASGIKNTAKDVIDTFNEGSKVDNTQ